MGQVQALGRWPEGSLGAEPPANDPYRCVGVSVALSILNPEFMFGLGGVRRYFHLSVQLTSRGSSSVPRIVLGVGSKDEEVSQVHGPGDSEVQL